jgi:hypothetical protein
MTTADAVKMRNRAFVQLFLVGGVMATGGGGSAARDGVVVNGAGGRFVGTPDLTEQQYAFVTAYLTNGEKQGDAAAAAGYAHPPQDGYRLMRNPAVMAAILDAQRRTAGRLRAVGVRALVRLAEDATTPPGVAREVALDLIALGDRWSGEAGNPDKPDKPQGTAAEQAAAIMKLLGPAVTLNIGVPPRADPEPLPIPAQVIDV